MRDRLLPRPPIAFALAGLLLLPCLVLGQLPATASEGVPSPRPEQSSEAQEILVSYRGSAAGRSGELVSPDERERRAELNRRAGGVAVRELRASGIQVVRLDADADPEDALAIYRADPTVELAELNQQYSTQETTDDAHFGKQWALQNTGQTGGRRDADIDARAAWNVTTGSHTVVVVVLDTGVDYRHPDLAGNVWTNPGEIPGDGRDNDRNGYVDDVHGYDTVDDDGDPVDENGHGTHVAGTIGARGNNGIGVAGVNWRVRIAACRFLDAGGSGTTDGALACLDYVQALRRAGVNVVATNNSWSGIGRSELLRRAIKAQDEVLFVAAAGNSSADNDALPAYPAGIQSPNVLSVSATDDEDRLAHFSNRGHGTVSLSAPGNDIVSLRAAGTDMYGDGEHFVPHGNPDARYYRASGTSMAAPHVAGVVALLKARYPRLDWIGVRNRILAGGDAVPGLDGSSVTGRRLNAYGALKCSDAKVFGLVGAPPTFPLLAGQSVTFRVLNISCADPGRSVQGTMSTGARFALRDDGRAPDVAADDGLFAATIVPRRDTTSVRFTTGGRQVVLPGISFGHYVPQAQVGTDFRHELRPDGATGPYRWSVVGGALPAGLTLGRDTGVISGTPTVAGRSLPQIRLVDATGRRYVSEIGVNVTADSMAERLLAVDRGSVKVVPQAHTIDGDGNTLVVGYYIDPTTQDEDFAIKKYDATGALLWTRLRTSDTTWWANWARDVAVDDSGNIYVVGGYPYFRSNSDFVLVKLDPDGNEVWATSYSNAEIELPSAVTIDPAGDIVVTGMSRTPDASSVLTAKFHPSGELVWARKFLEGIDDRGVDVRTDRDGNILVAGGSGSAVGPTPESFFGYSYLVLRYSPTGDLQWSRNERDPDIRSMEIAETIAVDEAGNSYLGGALNGSLHRYSPDGTLDWDAIITTAHDFDIHDIALGSDGDVVVVGSYFDQAEQQRTYAVASVDSSGAPLWIRRMEGHYDDDGADVTVDGTGLIRVTVPSDGGVVLTTFRATIEIATTELAPGLVGEDYRQRLRAQGGVRPISWELTGDPLPDGLSFDSATGVISGIPTAGGSSTITATVTTADGVSVSREYTLDVAHVSIEPTAGPRSFLVNEPMQQGFTTRGSGTPFTFSLVAGELPPGVTMDTDTGVIAGTPTAAGSFPVTVRVTDAGGHTAETGLTIVVVEPLTIVTTSLPDAVSGSPYSVTLEVTGGVGAPYTWGWSTAAPPGLQLDMNTGEISGVPSTPGVFDAGVFVYDTAINITSQAFTLTVS